MKIVHLSETEYRKLPAMNATALACLADATPAHWEWERTHPTRSPALEMGIALHMAVLEPDAFSRTYVVPPEVDRRTKQGKEDWASFMEANEGRTILPADQYETVRGMATSVLSHPEAQRWLEVCSEREVCLVGEYRGIPAKCRIDALDPASGLFLDLKSTRHRANIVACERAAHELNYFLRLALYRRLMQEAGMPWNGCSVIWVESKPPHAVNILPVASWAIDLMDKPLERAIQSYRDWQRDPTIGWPTTGCELGLPTWVANSLEVEDHR